MTDLEETRRRSAAIFGNEKTVEVVLALSEEGTGIPHSLVRDALVRLVNGGVVRQVPRIGGSRSPLYYQPTPGNLWAAVLAAAQAVAGPQESRTGRPPVGISGDG